MVSRSIRVLQTQLPCNAWIKAMLIFLQVLVASSVSSQERIGSYMAYSWRMGLSGGINSHVCESEDGHLWIATGNGLVKFDGRHYQQILSSPSTIPDNILTDVAISDDGKSLWIGSLRRGVTRFDVKTQKFRAYPKLWNYDSHTQSVRKILCLQNGQVWLGTSGMGLALYIPQTDTFQFFTPEPLPFYNGTPDLIYQVNDMAPDSKDSNLIWLICNNKIYQFDTRFKEFTLFPMPLNKDISWTCITHDGKDGLWLGSWGNGMFHYQTPNRQLQAKPYRLPNGKLERGMVVMDVEQVSGNSVLWACGFSGLLDFNPETGLFNKALPDFRLDESADTRLEYFNISRTKNAGVFAGAKGYLFQLHDNYSRLGKSIFPAPWAPEDEVYTGIGVFDNSTRQYLIPTAGPLSLLAVKQAGLRTKAIPIEQTGSAKGLKELANLPSGEILALGFDGNLYRLNAGKEELKPIPPLSGANGHFTQMKMDKKNYLWLLTQQNLYRLDASTLAAVDSFSFRHFDAPLEKTFNFLYLYHLETDASGGAWVGSSQGIWYAKPGEKQLLLFHPQNERGKWLRDKLIKSMVMDEKDRLWVGYNGDGLDIFDIKTFEVVQWQQEELLHPRQINGLVSTPGGFVLAPTTEGLLAVNKTTLEWQIFGTEDGLFSQFMDKGIWVSPDGMIFINHGTRLNVFHESALQINHGKMRVNIQRLTVNNVEQELSVFRDSVSRLSLPYSANNISITFSAMQWLYPFKTAYSYRFYSTRDTGVWTALEEPFIQLSALKPGSYTLELAAKGAGNTPSHPKMLYIKIHPPFWQRTWFVLLFSAMFLAAVYGLYRFRMNQLKKELEVRNTISTNLHDDIGSSLSNIQILTELANRSLENPEKASLLLKRSKEDILQISESLSEIVWNINPKYDDLQHLFARMKRYAAEALEGKEIIYNLHFPEEVGKSKMRMEQRRDFYLVFKESIHNLIKYSRADKATVTVEIHRHEAVLEVQDNGTGFALEGINPGNGLISMQQRADKWKGELSIESAPGKGTSIRLVLPLN